jgi:hypothetical protein
MTSDSRARHAREHAARAAVAQGWHSGGREYVRQAKAVRDLAPELFDKVAAGTITLAAAYRQVTGDDRVPLYLKLDADTDEWLRGVAAEQGITRQQWVLWMIETQRSYG